MLNAARIGDGCTVSERCSDTCGMRAPLLEKEKSPDRRDVGHRMQFRSRFGDERADYAFSLRPPPPRAPRFF